MNQEKIGKFISECRKKKNLTQEQLAGILGVSKNAVSKWERGLSLMDMSLLRPLCQELGVSVNELLAGERLDECEYLTKADENIVNVTYYTSKRINNKNNMIKLLCLVFFLLVGLILLVFSIDINRMRNNKEVFFSTWGFDYMPPVDLSEEKLYMAIEDYLILGEVNDRREYDDFRTFVSMKNYLIEEVDKDTYNVYSWVVLQNYYLDNGEVISDSGFSIPHKFILDKDGDSYRVISYKIPRDGSYYRDDMKVIFPRYVYKKMDEVHRDGTIEKLLFDVDRQMKNYFDLD